MHALPWQHVDTSCSQILCTIARHLFIACTYFARLVSNVKSRLDIPSTSSPKRLYMFITHVQLKHVLDRSETSSNKSQKCIRTGLEASPTLLRTKPIKAQMQRCCKKNIQSSSTLLSSVHKHAWFHAQYGVDRQQSEAPRRLSGVGNCR